MPAAAPRTRAVKLRILDTVRVLCSALDLGEFYRLMTDARMFSGTLGYIASLRSIRAAIFSMFRDFVLAPLPTSGNQDELTYDVGHAANQVRNRRQLPRHIIQIRNSATTYILWESSHSPQFHSSKA